MSQSDRVLYTARTHTTGGRTEGHSRSDDGNLDVKLSSPGSPGPGTNPEQLFASGWSACFEAAIAEAARISKVDLPEGAAIDAEVDLRSGEGGYTIAARLNVTMAGVERRVAEDLLAFADRICPYSKATRGNIDAVISLV